MSGTGTFQVVAFPFLGLEFRPRMVGPIAINSSALKVSATVLGDVMFVSKVGHYLEVGDGEGITTLTLTAD
jgi:hypothetical protein